MRLKILSSFIAFAAIGSIPLLTLAKAPAKISGRRIPNFVLPDASGKRVGLADFADKRCVVVVFLGTECPIANAYIPVLLDLQKKYRDKKFEVIGINANPGDSAEAIGKHLKQFGISFPVLVDAEQSTVALFGARRMAEVFLLDARRTVRYRGRIDDRIGYDFKRDEPRRRDLGEAIDELLAGKPVSIPETEPAGCLLAVRDRQKKQGTITYTGQVSAILNKHCVDCHHPGTAAPFSLVNYEQAANWSEMIGEVVAQRRMPPWHADPRYGKFTNERRMTQDEIDTVATWVDGGAPRGDAKEPAAPTFAEGWRIGKPDVIFKMPEEVAVQAKGTVRYKYFTTKTNFAEDMWVQAAEPRPGNRAVVHHIIVFYRDAKNPATAKSPVWIASVAPGADPIILPEGFGRKIPAGADLIWQMHYTPTGKEEKDRSEIGLVFCKKPPRHEVTTYGISNPIFKIPPGAANYKVISLVPAFKDAVVLSFFPHMHLRGKNFTYEAVYEDGRRELLLSVPQYDFNWQHTYRLEKPLRLPKGARIECTAHFDNSAENPANPDPTKTVRYGEQTWDEMMIGYIDYHWDDAKK